MLKGLCHALKTIGLYTLQYTSQSGSYRSILCKTMPSGVLIFFFLTSLLKFKIWFLVLLGLETFW